MKAKGVAIAAVALVVGSVIAMFAYRARTTGESGSAPRTALEGAELDTLVDDALHDARKLGPARDRLERAVASTDPSPPRRRAVLELSLGTVELAAGDSFAAITTLEHAADHARTALPYKNPELAVYLDELAAAKVARGKIRDALALHDQGLALRTSAFGLHSDEVSGDGRAGDDASVATSLLHRAQTEIEAGDLDRAHDDLERARKIREHVSGDTSRAAPGTGAAHEANLGDIDLARGDTSRGAPGTRAAHEANLGDIDLARGDAYAAAGKADLAAGAYSRAIGNDPRLDVFARRFAIGSSIDAATIPPLDPRETLSIDRAAALAARVALRARQGNTDDARALAQALHTRFRDDLDPALTISIAAALLATGDRNAAAAIYTAAITKLGNEPTRTALATYIGLARSTDGPRAAQAARVAISLFQALPLLARTDYDAMDALTH
ncbi:MAG: hypothetical protein JWO36_487 [Myxococcales bacterium]|nr:hypothetical protein [Myxococcales bacterium]